MHSVQLGRGPPGIIKIVGDFCHGSQKEEEVLDRENKIKDSLLWKLLPLRAPNQI